MNDVSRPRPPAAGRVSPVDDLLRAVARDGCRPLLRSRGEVLSTGELANRARGAAAVLSRRGVSAGDRVALVSGSSIDRVVWMFGIWWLGAVEVSVNVELRGPMLAHVLADSDPRLIVCQDACLEQVREAAAGDVLPMSELAAGPVGQAERDELDAAQRNFGPGDLATILYTSGTTGPAKGVMLPRAYFSNLAEVWIDRLGLNADDIGYFPLPFFHVDAHVKLIACLQSGSSMAFRERFSASEYFADVRRFGATWASGVGAMLSILAQGELPEPGSHRLTRMIGAPIPQIAYETFEDRLGIPVLTLFGQTECDGIAMDSVEQRRRGAAGHPHDAIDVQVVDENDRPLPPGETGEILYRPRRPYLTALGYWRRPEATVEAWRNLWFHTGDSGHLDADGFLHFDGRRTDSFRRRGENISVWELEHSLNTAGGVRECVAIAVRDEHGGEDEIKVFVVPDGESLVLDEFVAHCRKVLPRFAMPRYLTVTDGAEFVRSAGTGVVQKHLLSRDITSPEVVEVPR
ncbi:AMP-binding protein [Amycolatopsis sp. NPDC059090]|uniref:AMP-binding protein n=1 Tax=unclassified Amycolatopsis TaxID=2618356 RepID=UPI00366B58C2